MSTVLHRNRVIERVRLETWSRIENGQGDLVKREILRQEIDPDQFLLHQTIQQEEKGDGSKGPVGSPFVTMSGVLKSSEVEDSTKAQKKLSVFIEKDQDHIVMKAIHGDEQVAEYRVPRKALLEGDFQSHMGLFSEQVVGAVGKRFLTKEQVQAELTATMARRMQLDTMSSPPLEP